MFQFPRLAFPAYVFNREWPGFARPGFPIRRSTGSLLPANRGLSQVATSFIASRCQGIHRMPLVAWLKNPTSQAPRFRGTFGWLESFKTLLIAVALLPLHSTVKDLGSRSVEPTTSRDGVLPPVALKLFAFVPAASAAHPLVEMNGFEPSTSGLQSPRSPN